MGFTIFTSTQLQVKEFLIIDYIQISQNTFLYFQVGYFEFLINPYTSLYILLIAILKEIKEKRNIRKKLEI